jgi:hypothetical protein
MTTTDDNSTTITFRDHAENQEGFAIIRRFEGKVAICLSLEENGDVEALIEKEVVERLIESLKSAIA